MTARPAPVCERSTTVTVAQRAHTGLWLVVALALLLAACSSETPGAAATHPPAVTATASATADVMAEPTPTPTSTPTPTPTPEPTQPIAPLTGLEVEDPASLERPVLAVKIDNLAPARPQTGLEDADIVFVELVESATRFLALYHSTDPGVVGPVRSARAVEADILPAYEPVLAISGAAPPVYDALDGAGLLRVADDEIREVGGPEGIFSRDGSRRAPHNLYAATAPLWELGADLPAAEPPWPFAAETPARGGPAAGVDLAYPGLAGDYGWTWDEAQGRWLRTQRGSQHLTAEGEQLAADTVVLARVPANPDVIRPFLTIGEGEAVILRDGQAFTGSWRKTGPEEHFSWVGPDGEPLPLKPGTTWVELLPATGTATLR